MSLQRKKGNRLSQRQQHAQVLADTGGLGGRQNLAVLTVNREAGSSQNRPQNTLGESMTEKSPVSSESDSFYFLSCSKGA